MANYGTDASSFVAGTGHVVAYPETGTWRGLPTTWRCYANPSRHGQLFAFH